MPIAAAAPRFPGTRFFGTRLPRTTLPPRPQTAQRGGLRVSLAGLARTGVLIAFAASGLVFSEPAPSDLVMFGLIVLLPLAGLQRLAPGMIANFTLWLGCGAGGLLASTASRDIAGSTRHTAISIFLYVATLVLAAFIARRPAAHTRMILAAWVFAALAAAVAGIVGYFELAPGAFDLFTKFGRATGTFKDPNVFGPFLVPPALYLAHRLLHREARWPILDLAALGVLVIAVLLSFSRGAWFSLAVATGLLGFLSLVTITSTAGRARLLGIGIVGLVLAAAALIVVAHLPAVADLLAQRSELTQSYDVGPQGRFGGQAKAIGLLITHPLGLGAHEFTLHYHHEDVHNVYLSMFLNAGWLGGLLYIAGVATTLWAGFAHVLKGTPTRPLFLIALAAFTGNVLEGFIIDTDHWRHFYVLMAMIWGMIGADHRQTSMDHT